MNYEAFKQECRKAGVSPLSKQAVYKLSRKRAIEDAAKALGMKVETLLSVMGETDEH